MPDESSGFDQWFHDNVAPFFQWLTQTRPGDPGEKGLSLPPVAKKEGKPPSAVGELVKPSPGLQKQLEQAPIKGLLEALNVKNIVTWLIIVAVGLIGVWGLVQPGRGVAIITRGRR